MVYRLLADVVLIIHLIFVVFVVLGGLLVWRWQSLAWVHIPAALWGTYIEISGRVCPLTPLENHLRRLGGESGYADSFVEHYLWGILYPAGLTSNTQLLLAAVVVAANLAIYGGLLFRRRGRP